jgi:hypothetical protein
MARFGERWIPWVIAAERSMGLKALMANLLSGPAAEVD